MASAKPSFKSYILPFILFLLINFAALAIGGFFTNSEVKSEWYLGLSKAPWTPPGWVFGAAWTTIMICFSFYMSQLWFSSVNKRNMALLFAIQWFLNVGWNPVFFYYHELLMGLVIISALTILMGVFLFGYWSKLKFKSILLLPYFIWLLIATSLNGYILFNN